MCDCSCLLVTIGTDLAIIAIYRPYAFKDTTKFIQSLDLLLRKLNSYKNIILVGDINIDIAHSNSANNYLDYLDLLAHHGLFIGHTFVTHGSACLDHSNLKTSLSAKVLIIESTITDHYAVMTLLSLKQRLTCNHFSLVKIDKVKLANDFLNIDFNLVYTTNDPNIATDHFIQPILNAISLNSKSVTLPCRRRTIRPWITGVVGLLRCMHHRDCRYKQSRRESSNDILLLSYKRYRNYCTNLLRKAKRDYEKLEFLKVGKNPRQMWNVIRKVTNTNKSKSSSEDLIFAIANKQQGVNDINSYFSSVGFKLANKIESELKIPYQRNYISSSSVLIDTDESEVDGLIMSLKSNCSCGWDGISSEFLKEHKDIIIPPLTHICNLSMSTGVFPNHFKKAIIYPVYKSGDRNQIGNYRPISVLPTMLKILEKIMNSRLVSYLEAHSLISPNQYGFRKKFSSADAVHSLVDYIVRKLDGRQKCIALFSIS